MKGQWTMILFPRPLLHSHSEHFLRQLLWGQDDSLVGAIEREHHLTKLSPLQTSQLYALPQWNPLIPSPRRFKSRSPVPECIYPFIRDTPSPRKQGRKEPRGSSESTLSTFYTSPSSTPHFLHPALSTQTYIPSFVFAEGLVHLGEI